MALDIALFYVGIRGLRNPCNTRGRSPSSLAGAMERVSRSGCRFDTESAETLKFSQILRVHLFTFPQHASWHSGQAFH